MIDGGVSPTPWAGGATVPLWSQDKLTYASITDVRAIVPLVVISGTTKPTETQVLEFLELCNGEVDAALSSRGLTVPVAAPEWFVTDVRTVEATGAAARTLMAMFPSSLGPSSNSQGQLLWNDYRRRLDEYRRGVGIPSVGVDDGGLDSISAPRSYMRDNGAVGAETAVDAWGDEIQTRPTFTRGKVF